MRTEKGFNENIDENFDEGRCETTVPAKAPMKVPIGVPGIKSIKIPRRVSMGAKTSEEVRLDWGSNEIPMRFRWGF